MGLDKDQLGGIMQLSAAATPLVMGMLANRDAKERAENAAKEANELGKQIAAMEGSRQDIVNPYANLGVATQAAQFEASEVDQSLASTLDTLRATGGGAASATALAREAARSKQTISADIQKQEQANQKLKAEGEDTACNRREHRDLAKLDRLANLQEGYQQREMDALAGQQAVNQATAGAVGGVVGEIAANPDQLSALFGG